MWCGTLALEGDFWRSSGWCGGQPTKVPPPPRVGAGEGRRVGAAGGARGGGGGGVPAPRAPADARGRPGCGRGYGRSSAVESRPSSALSSAGRSCTLGSDLLMYHFRQTTEKPPYF
eukprot:gene12467-biopygen420